MRLPTDKEFNQRETKKPNKKFKVNVSNSRLNRGHTVAAEQKIRGLKKRLRFFKRLVKGAKRNKYNLMKDSKKLLLILISSQL